METETLEEFFFGIDKQLQDRQREVRGAVKNFFDELAPRIKVARELDRERDRIFAHRFNVLDYLRTDELGLSGIIADLLNPIASHGQRKLFLETFLKLLQKEKDCGIDTRWLDFDQESVTVETEKHIETCGRNRRLDICLTIKNNAGTYCISFENKPSAADEFSQVKDYLNYFESEKDAKRCDDFLVIYLSSGGQNPSEYSLPKSEYKRWKGRLKIMSYCDNAEVQVDEYEPEDFGISFSLKDWFKKCKEGCDVDRLRSFLRDAEQFCEMKFRGGIMAHDSELKVIEKYITEDRIEHLNIARLIHDSYPIIRKSIYNQFINILREKIKSSLTDSKYGVGLEFDQGDGNLRLRKKNWDARICIHMEPGWMGVHINRKNNNNKFSDEKYTEMANKIWGSSGEYAFLKDNNSAYPFYFYMDIKIRNWHPIICDIFDEIKEGGGNISRQYASNFIEVAKTFIPVIDNFQNEKGM